MENNAMIKIVTVQQPFDGGAEDRIELETLGKFSKKNDKFYIMYDETELTGFKNTKTIVKIAKDNIIISRKGDVESKMEFSLGGKRLCNYNTPYGMIPVATELREFENDLSEDGGKVKLSYTIDFNNESYALNTLHISVRTKG